MQYNTVTLQLLFGVLLESGNDTLAATVGDRLVVLQHKSRHSPDDRPATLPDDAISDLLEVRVCLRCSNVLFSVSVFFVGFFLSVFFFVNTTNCQ
jgi:hypothetical protein